MVIPLVALNNTDTLSRAGIGTVQMKMNTAPEIRTIALSPGATIFVKYDPGTSDQDYSVAWSNYFTGTMKMTEVACPIGGPDARCFSYRTDGGKPASLVIKKFEVTIQSL
jgi:hypothetical protein